ncbi:MAG: CBS domain-containing protein, partial [Lapillicoccus sp.]
GGTAHVGDRLRRFEEVAQVGDTLRRALAEIVQHDAGWLPVVDGDRYLGVLTPSSVHAALRRAIPHRESADMV